MADKQNVGTSAADPKEVIAGDPTKYGKRVSDGDQMGSQHSEEQPSRMTQQARREVEASLEKTAAAGEEALRAGREVLRTNVQTSQDAMLASVEAGKRVIEDFGNVFSRTFGVTTPNPELAEQSARNVQAVSQATMALSRGAQEASRAWFELAQQGVRSNVEAISQIAGCRTLQDVFAVQSNLARENLRRMIEGTETITRSSSQAIEEANRAIQSVEQGQSATR